MRKSIIQIGKELNIDVSNLENIDLNQRRSVIEKFAEQLEKEKENLEQEKIENVNENEKIELVENKENENEKIELV